MRIKEGREKPIDFFHKIIMIWKEYYPLPLNYTSVNEYNKPYLVFNILNENELSEVHENIITQLAIEKDRLLNSNFIYTYFDIVKKFKIQLELKLNDVEDFIDYWSALLVLCESYLYSERNLNRLSSVFKAELCNIVNKKSFEELYEMELQAQKSADEANSGEDNEYWTNTVNYIKNHRCILVLNKLGKTAFDKSLIEEKNNKNLVEENNINDNNDYIYYDKLGNKVEINYNNKNGEYSPVLYSSDDEVANNTNKFKANDYILRLENARKKILANLIENKVKQINNLAESLHISKSNKHRSNLKSKISNPNYTHREKGRSTSKIKCNNLNNQNFKSTVRMTYNKLNEEKEKRLRLGKRNNKNISLKNRNFKVNNQVAYSTKQNEIQIKINNNILSEDLNKKDDLKTLKENTISLKKEDKFYKEQLKNYSDSDSNSELDRLLGKKKNNMIKIKSNVNLEVNKKLIEEPNKSLLGNRFLIVENANDDNAYKRFEKLEKEENENEIVLKETHQHVQTIDYSWASVYKPRKPRYINRVKTGYEWNKYYQKHYDYDNPPPKVIQGYKFNIFYPDLIDKSNTPQYSIERSDIKDTCILRFSAGAPYEDISFNIVNREWDMNEKSGFKNYFDRGIYYLYFNFKRFRYKR
jgi:hypothetical protein